MNNYLAEGERARMTASELWMMVARLHDVFGLAEPLVVTIFMERPPNSSGKVKPLHPEHM